MNIRIVYLVEFLFSVALATEQLLQTPISSTPSSINLKEETIGQEQTKILSHLDNLVDETNEAIIASDSSSDEEEEGLNENDTENYYTEIHKHLYAHDGRVNKPIETAITLRQLEQLYSTGNKKKFAGRLKNVRDLIKLSSIGEEKCNQNTFMKFNSLIKKNSPKRLNIVAYLKYYRGEQFLKCKSILEKAVNKLEENEKNDINELKSKMIDTSRGETHSPRANLIKALAGLIKRRELNINNDDKDKKDLLGLPEFSEKFKHTVGLVCEKISEELKQLMGIYNLFTLEEDLVEQIDSFTLSWITNARMCRYILEDNDMIVDEIYAQLVNKDLDQIGNSEHSWRSIQWQLYSQDAPDIPATKTLNLLRGLRKLFSNKKESEFVARKENVKALLEFSKINLSKCTIGQFKLFEANIEQNYSDRKNIANYLEFYREKQFKFCENLLHKRITENFNQDMKENLEILTKSIIERKSNRQLGAIKRKNVIRGLESFMTHKAGPVSRFITTNLAKDMENFELAFKEKVEDLCIAIEKTLNPWKTLYFAYTDNKYLSDNMDKSTIEWFTYGRVCREVMWDLPNTITKTYAEMIKKNPTPRFFNRFLRFKSVS